MKYWFSAVLVGLSGLILVACGSGSERSDDPDYSQLREPASTQGALTDQHPPSDFARYLRNGLRLRVPGGTEYGDGQEVAMPAEDSSDAASNSGNFSGTNVHVEGVDEADRLKYDGSHLFVAESPYFSYAHFAATSNLELGAGEEIPQGQAMRILSTNPSSVGATEMARYVFERSESSSLVLSELYTLEDSAGQTNAVAALSDTRLHYDAWSWGAMPFIDAGEVSTRVDLVNVESPTNPQLAWSIELEGSLENSRKIGDILYLVTRFTPGIEGLEPYARTPEQRRRNESLISNASIADLLPQYQVDDGSKQPLVFEERCFLPSVIAPNEGYAELVTISAIDLRRQEVVSSACINARLSGLYMSLEGLYLGASISTSSTDSDAQAVDSADDVTSDSMLSGSATALHKFIIEAGDINYRGSGAVPGELNWSDPSFSMDDQGGYLRVITTDRRSWNDLEHYLHVLHEPDNSAGNELEIVARLPNEDRPAAIGEPGEDIFAVRFLGDKAYVVTFQQTDPLYVIDLTDNENPSIAGELKIPGVSTYLHPVAPGYLVSVGEQTTDTGAATGVKVELFDIRDDTQPRSIATEVIGGRGSWSEALRELRAFNFMPVGEDQFRFTLPVTRYDDYQWRDSGLHFYEINDLKADQATLRAAGSLIVERNDETEHYYPQNSGNARSRLHDDTVYYLHGNAVWASSWSDPDNVQGPF